MTRALGQWQASLPPHATLVPSRKNRVDTVGQPLSADGCGQSGQAMSPRSFKEERSLRTKASVAPMSLHPKRPGAQEERDGRFSLRLRSPCFLGTVAPGDPGLLRSQWAASLTWRRELRPPGRSLSPLWEEPAERTGLRRIQAQLERVGGEAWGKVASAGEERSRGGRAQGRPFPF